MNTPSFKLLSRITLLAFCIFYVSFSILGQKNNSEFYKDSTQKRVLLKTSLGLGYMAAGYAMYKYGDYSIQHESRELVGPFLNKANDVFRNLGASKTLWIGSGATFAGAYLMKDKKLQRTAFLWAGTLLVNDLITSTIKETFQRHRPNTGDPYNTFDWSEGPGTNSSFPSAHTSYSFATATVFATMYKDKKWVPPLAYGMASLIGLSRVYSNAHWFSDVMAGAAIGFLTAKGVIGLYRLADKKYILIIPQIGEKFGSLKVMYRF